MALDLNDPELEFSDLVYAYQSWVMAVINDEKLDSEDKLLTDDITEDALNSMRFLPGEVTSAIETSLARVYDVDPDELAELLLQIGILIHCGEEGLQILKGHAVTGRGNDEDPGIASAKSP